MSHAVKRSLDYAKLGVSCHRQHPPIAMKEIGYFSLKEAGAAMTVLGYECPRCFWRLFVTEENPLPLDRSTLEMDVEP